MEGLRDRLDRGLQVNVGSVSVEDLISVSLAERLLAASSQPTALFAGRLTGSDAPMEIPELGAHRTELREAARPDSVFSSSPSAASRSGR